MIWELMDMARAVSDAVHDIPLEERAREVADGADGTPTSHIDKVAEDVILDFVEEHDMPVNILSEEAGYIDRGHEDVLVVDPVDGTFNCKRGIPYFSVSLAVGTDDLDGIKYGVVKNIPTGDLFYAEKGGGAFLNNERLATKPANKNNMVIASYFGRVVDPHSHDIAGRFNKVRAFGAASLDINAVASGQVDAFYLKLKPDVSTLRVTDIAASILILREAGGEAYHLDGRRLEMKLALEDRSNMFAIGDTSILEEML